MNTTAADYIKGLKAAYYDRDARAEWDHFEQIKQGADPEDLRQLAAFYPQAPQVLFDLLSYADGTYWREYAGEQIALYFLGSDVEGYPYYLLSAKEMIANEQLAAQNYGDYIERTYEEVDIDGKITDDKTQLQWLHFADCMNNGGTSQLFLDFSPSPEGKAGQVVRFLHDPDELKVIANGFSEYLGLLIANQYDFIDEELL
ncbi:MAG: SMI1/KNR4 family protein [Sphingobacteriales bacterium]|nr:MAG: SMI1/KNR4 family protein [Sphingobacteriales bacterium]